jgi:hypothetical protein
MAARITWRIPIWTLFAVSYVVLPDMAAASAESPPTAPGETPLERGRRVATAVATVTGTAISPIFGVCILSAYKYVRTQPPNR